MDAGAAARARAASGTGTGAASATLTSAGGTASRLAKFGISKRAPGASTTVSELRRDAVDREVLTLRTAEPEDTRDGVAEAVAFNG
ncbi:MAG: hypothetical protein ACKO2P_00585 [Planctomycetota bacterium]